MSATTTAATKDDPCPPPDQDGPGLYIPDNLALAEMLAKVEGAGFRADHAALMLHFIAVKRWMGDLDYDGFARLNSSILRMWIQSEVFGGLKRFLVKTGVILTKPHSARHFSTGFKIGVEFDGLPRRYTVTYPPLAAKLRRWRSAHKPAGIDPDLQAIIARRRHLLDHLGCSLRQLSLPDNPGVLVETLRNQADSGHVSYVAQCILHHDHDGLSIDGFGWRIHNLITRTSSILRPFLLLGRRPILSGIFGQNSMT